MHGHELRQQRDLVITTLLLQQFDLELVTQRPDVARGTGANRPTPTIIRYLLQAAIEKEKVAPWPPPAALCISALWRKLFRLAFHRPPAESLRHGLNPSRELIAVIRPAQSPIVDPSTAWRSQPVLLKPYLHGRENSGRRPII